ncbi:MAG TPA: adenine phosphoribosyltransferase [Dehalococcoidia bacterium]|nr:adenine phosphoribosyltransferase [Dehalococcoidia bacterium]
MTAALSLAERLRSLIFDVPDFPTPGVMFRDITTLLADAAALRDAVVALAAPHREAGVDLVAGIESRGFIIGGAVALELGAGFVPVRKQGRLPRQTISAAYELEYGNAVLEVHADTMVQGHHVLIVDDVLATGGTAAAAMGLVRTLGAELVGLAFLVELTELRGAERLAGAPYTALVHY